jgi:hypothetical protein
MYTISEDSMRPDVVRMMLQWMYLQEITVPQDDLMVSMEEVVRMMLQRMYR